MAQTLKGLNSNLLIASFQGEHLYNSRAFSGFCMVCRLCFFTDLLPGAVKKAFDKMVDFFKTANTSEILQEFSVCNLQQPTSASLVADNLLFLAEQTFANLNMGNYPPNSETGRVPA